MAREPPAAGLARPATAVDLADDAPARIRTGFGDADELVSEDAAEAHVALDELQVRFADAGASDANEHFAVGGVGRRVRCPKTDIVIEHNRAHRCDLRSYRP
jgi:hypothetical protein